MMLQTHENISMNSIETIPGLEACYKQQVAMSETVGSFDSGIDIEMKENNFIHENNRLSGNHGGEPCESQAGDGLKRQCVRMIEKNAEIKSSSVTAPDKVDQYSSCSADASRTSSKKTRSAHDSSAPVTFEASEFIAFAMYRLWNPNGSSPEICTRSCGNQSRSTSGSMNRSLSRKNAVKRRSPSLSSDESFSTSSTSISSSKSLHTLSVAPTPPLSIAHPSPKRHKSSPKFTRFPAEDNFICPHGTEWWYRSYVCQTHMLLKSIRLGTPFIFLALLYAARLRQFVQATPSLLNSLMESSSDDTFCSDSDDDLDQECRIEFKILTVCLMLAQKQHGDSRYSNKAWSNLSSLPFPFLNCLERKVLLGIRYSLHVRDSVYTKWVHGMRRLGKEHALVIRCVSMSSEKVDQALKKLGNGRKDLVEEIYRVRNIYS